MDSPTWVLKPEPASPQLYEDVNVDTWFFEDGVHDMQQDVELTAFKQVKHEEIESKAEVYSKLLDDLDQLDRLEDFIKEEPFSNWLEEKVEIPIFENIHIEPRYLTQRFKHEDLKPISQPINHVVLPLVNPLVQPLQQIHPVQQVSQDSNTNLLLQEFESIYGAVELTHGQLTPPQSPPLNSQPVLTTLTPITNKVHLPVYYQQNDEPATPQPDVAHELAEVEELVRSRAENLVDNWEPSPSSPSSSSSSGFSEYSSDPEWIPDTVQSTSDPGSSLVERTPRGRKRAGKPYSKAGPEDKKSRKKEQNKNAATRYRLKKKAEVEEILSEERGLAETKSNLMNQVGDLQREIKCLKGLMRDLFKAKGLIQ